MSFAVFNISPSFDLDAEDMTNLMIVAMVITGTLNVGEESFYEKNMWDPARLREKRLFRYEASDSATKIISLDLLVMPPCGYVAT